MEKNQKKQINLVNLKELLRGRDWDELTEQEQLEISKKIVDLISCDKRE